jgi:hypothetical protein
VTTASTKRRAPDGHRCRTRQVEPRQRESYLASCESIVEKARGTAGCLDCAISADLIDSGRVNIFERWESQAAVEAFRGGRGGPSDEQGAAMLSASVGDYDVSDVRPIFDKALHEHAARTVWRPVRSVPPTGQFQEMSSTRERRQP